MSYYFNYYLIISQKRKIFLNTCNEKNEKQMKKKPIDVEIISVSDIKMINDEMMNGDTNIEYWIFNMIKHNCFRCDSIEI